MIPCLRAMAMGDLNAVAYGQTAHLGMLTQGGLPGLIASLLCRRGLLGLLGSL